MKDEKPISILKEADVLTNGQRLEDYGHPFDDLSRTGRIWGAILGIPDILPETVGLMMNGLKVSRECNNHLRDNLVDGCGYLNIVDMIHQHRQNCLLIPTPNNGGQT